MRKSMSQNEHEQAESRPELVASVIVATYQRADRLTRLINALDAQLDVGPFEVIVVDDASSDHTWTELERLRTESTCTLKSLRLDSNSGPAVARNIGWRAAGAPIIAFIDDDCVPHSSWLAALVEAMKDADVVQGRTCPDPAQLYKLGPFSQTVEVTGPGFYETCNIAYSRELLARIGGFDEQFRYPYGEDVDLGCRAKNAGARTTFRINALVYHDVSTSSFLRHVRRARQLGGAVMLLRLHPELRPILYRGLFYRPSHPRAIIAGLGLLMIRPSVAVPLRAAGALAILAYAQYRIRREPLPGGPCRNAASIPAALAADLAEIAVLAWASARHRTLML
jgi:glycosyltransferase involved in cell wall biosynthesis